MLAQSILYKPAGNGTLWQTPLSVNKEETNIVQYNQVCYSVTVHNEELCSNTLTVLKKKPLFLLWLSTVPHQYPSWESCKLLNVAAVDQHLCVGMGSLWRDQEKTDQREGKCLLMTLSQFYAKMCTMNAWETNIGTLLFRHLVMIITWFTTSLVKPFPSFYFDVQWN